MGGYSFLTIVPCLDEMAGVEAVHLVQGQQAPLLYIQELEEPMSGRAGLVHTDHVEGGAEYKVPVRPSVAAHLDCGG